MVRLILILLSIAAAAWRLTFTAIPLDTTAAGLNRDAAHFLLGALIMGFFIPRIRWVCIACFVALTVLEGVMFLAFEP